MPAGEPAFVKGECQATLYGHTLRDSPVDSLLKCTATPACRVLAWGINARPETASLVLSFLQPGERQGHALYRWCGAAVLSVLHESSIGRHLRMCRVEVA